MTAVAVTDFLHNAVGAMHYQSRIKRRRMPIISERALAKSEHQILVGRTICAVLPAVAAVLLSPRLIKVHDAYQETAQQNHSTWRADSPAARDVMAVAAADRQAMTRTYEYTILLLASASDHLRAIADLLGHRHGFFPNFSLARAVLEAAARAWYLLDPEIDCDERLRRYLNERLVSLQEQVWLLTNIGDATDDKRAEITEILLTAELHGYPVRRSSGRPSSIGLQRRPTTAALIHELIPDPTGTMAGKALYQVMSAVVHAAPHALTKEVFETDEPEGDLFGTDVVMVIALFVFIEAAFRALDQLGWDPANFRRRAVGALIFFEALLEGDQRRATTEESGVRAAQTDDATIVNNPT
jgi:hypothetical protein